MNESAPDVGGRRYDECAVCGKAVAPGRPLCDPCAAKNKDSVSFGVLLLGSIGYLLVMTGWLGQRVWHWPRAASVVFGVAGVLVLLDAVRAFRFRRRVYRKGGHDRS